MNTTFKSFSDGFVGSFKLAVAIVIAIASVASAFVADEVGDRKSNDEHSHT